MIKKFNQYNESLRDKMVSVSEEEIIKILDKYKDKYYIKSVGFPRGIPSVYKVINIGLYDDKVPAIEVEGLISSEENGAYDVENFNRMFKEIKIKELIEREEEHNKNRQKTLDVYKKELG